LLSEEGSKRSEILPNRVHRLGIVGQIPGRKRNSTYNKRLAGFLPMETLAGVPLPHQQGKTGQLKNGRSPMALEIENLKFKRIIVHEVLLASELEAGKKPELSEEPIELDPKGADLLAVRLSQALGSSSHSIDLNVDQHSQGSAFDVTTRLLDAPKKDFISLSKELADKLAKAQTAGSVKSGVAVIIEGTMGTKAENRRFVCLIKADSDSSFSRERTARGVLLKYIDVVLGAQQRLYKIGCFIEKAETSPTDGEPRLKDDFDVLVYDHLMSNSGDTNAARYFYGSFMGCSLLENAARVTRQFYEKTSEYIDKMKLPPAERYEKKQCLISYMKSQKKSISARDYADDFLEPKFKDGYLEWVYKNGIPKRDMAKDLSAIKRRLQVRRIVFQSKVRISGPGEDFDDLVKVGKLVDGWTELKVRGDIEAQK
jgi:hypothetical protein